MHVHASMAVRVDEALAENRRLDFNGGGCSV
jgi:hypothetical protein